MAVPFTVVANLRARAGIVSAIRAWFDAAGFTEVETPVRLPAPANEPHILPPPSGRAFLRASPELQMKRLLAAGMERIYQIGPCFREGERGDRHAPEFSMLEWYRSPGDYLAILDDMRGFCNAAAAAPGVAEDAAALFAAPWETITVREAYRRWAGWDPVAAFDAERFDLDMALVVEPALPRDRVCTLIDYPRQAASLARLKSEGDVAERWEVYARGLELANAFGELTDAAEQRARFDAARREKISLGETPMPLDEDFLAELPSIQSAGGAALGVDRLVMTLLGAASIDEVRAFLPETGKLW